MVMKTVLTAAYGFDITEEDPDYVELVIDGLNRAAALGVPGINIIDFLPFCECPSIICIRRSSAHSSVYQCISFHHGFLEQL